MKIRATVKVKGIVQGVAFRHHTAQTAARHGVTGWVRNRYDGSVQACFEGEEEDVRAVVQWCQSGPPAAMVESVSVEDGDYTGEFSGFSVRHDHD